MAQVALSSKIRKGTGKGVARKLRALGQVPGVLYGPSTEPVHLELDEKGLSTLVQSKGLNQILELTIEGGSSGTHLCLIKDLQRDVYQQKILHVDFRRIDLNEKIVVTVRLTVEGEAPIRAKGGIVEQMVRGVRLRVQATNIPTGLSCDISGLRLGQTITIGQLALPEGAELVDNPDQAIVNIFASRGSLMSQQG